MLGSQTPRYRTVPQGAVSSWGPEAVDLAATVGLFLDDGQADVLTDGLSEGPDGKWLASEVADDEPRQNGKGSILEARALAGLYLLREPLIIWTAHEFKTANEGFLRMRGHIDNWDHLRKRVRAIRSSTHAVEIELFNPKRRLAFLARSGGSGRGFAGVAPLFLDEAFALTQEQMAALIFAMSAHPNPQVWYMSSAPLVDSLVLRDICSRGRRGSQGLVYYEWSSSGRYEDLERLVAANKALSDEEAEGTAAGRELRERLFAKVAEANRAFNVRIQPSSILRELKATGVEQFLRERLGVFVEDLGEVGFRVIPERAWTGRLDVEARLDGRPAFGVYVPPDRSCAAIAAAGPRAAGGLMVELTGRGEVDDFRPSTGWVVPRLLELEEHSPSVVVIDDKALADEAEAAGLVVHRAVVADVVTGCQLFFDGVTRPDPDGRDVWHLGQKAMTDAVAGAVKRKVGSSWAWERHDLTADIGPLAAASLALFGHSTPRVHRPLPMVPMVAWR